MHTKPADYQGRKLKTHTIHQDDLFEDLYDTEPSILIDKLWVQMRSEIWWFTSMRKSHCLSRFAASFLVTRVESSIVKSF